MVHVLWYYPLGTSTQAAIAGCERFVVVDDDTFVNTIVGGGGSNARAVRGGGCGELAVDG